MTVDSESELPRSQEIEREPRRGVGSQRKRLGSPEAGMIDWKNRRIYNASVSQGLDPRMSVDQRQDFGKPRLLWLQIL